MKEIIIEGMLDAASAISFKNDGKVCIVCVCLVLFINLQCSWWEDSIDL